MDDGVAGKWDLYSLTKFNRIYIVREIAVHGALRYIAQFWKQTFNFSNSIFLFNFLDF